MLCRYGLNLAQHLAIDEAVIEFYRSILTADKSSALSDSSRDRGLHQSSSSEFRCSRVPMDDASAFFRSDFR